MEVLVRNLDQLEDLILVFLRRFIWRMPRMSVSLDASGCCLNCRYGTVIHCFVVPRAGLEPALPIEVTSNARKSDGCIDRLKWQKCWRTADES